MINKVHQMENRELFHLMQKAGLFFNLCYADMMFDEKTELDLNWLYDLRRCAAPASTIYIHTDKRSVCDVHKALIDHGWHIQAWVIWPYNWGGRSPRMWAAKHDDIIVATMDKKHWTFNVKDVEIPKKTLINSTKTHQIPTDCWSDIGILHTMAKEKDKGQHRKWQKPEKLLERVIKASSNEGDLVLDPFCGTGTTADVAKRLGRNFITCDVLKECVDIARKRLELEG